MNPADDNTTGASAHDPTPPDAEPVADPADEAPEAVVVESEVVEEPPAEGETARDDEFEAEAEDHEVVPPEADPRSPEELRAALDEAERASQEYLDHLRRERAEFENYRRRSAKAQADAKTLGAEQMVNGLLPVLDNFAYVLEAAEESSDETLCKGVEMVHAELLRTLGESGLERIDATGVPFDPTMHEAVSQVSAPEPTEEPVVHEVMRAGYRFSERVLRPASVVVAQ